MGGVYPAQKALVRLVYSVEEQPISIAPVAVSAISPTLPLESSSHKCLRDKTSDCGVFQRLSSTDVLLKMLRDQYLEPFSFFAHSMMVDRPLRAEPRTTTHSTPT